MGIRSVYGDESTSGSITLETLSVTGASMFLNTYPLRGNSGERDNLDVLLVGFTRSKVVCHYVKADIGLQEFLVCAASMFVCF